ncbi:MAG: hypothetical protein PHW54_02525 [Candidatus Omnitrophica bacterium]|jgi:hypothetical protein|nr:hypothetical protein [Candidatus Omnitrophota bacterium]
MNIIVLTISAGLLFVLLMAHSYIIRGARITITFFLFAFALMFYKESIRPLLDNVSFIQVTFPRSYELLIQNVPGLVRQLTVITGWMITFYLSWCFSEQILLRFNNFKKKLFPALVFSLMATASICYCMETIGANMGWWAWKYYTPNLERFLMGFPIEAVTGWVHMGFFVLASFFLMECSKYKTAKWKGVFLLIYLMHLWFIPVFGFMKYFIAMNFLIINAVFFSFFSSLRLEYPEPRFMGPNHKLLRYINLLPLLVASLILLFVVISEIFLLKEPQLIISIIPLLTILFLSIKKIPLFFILILSASSFFIMKERAIFSLVPVIFAIMLWAIDKIYQLTRPLDMRNL